MKDSSSLDRQRKPQKGTHQTYKMTKFMIRYIQKLSNLSLSISNIRGCPMVQKLFHHMFMIASCTMMKWLEITTKLNDFLEICTIFDYFCFCYSYMNNFQTTLTVSPSMSVVSSIFLSFSGLPAACIKVFTMSTYPTIIKHKMITNRFQNMYR